MATYGVRLGVASHDPARKCKGNEGQETRPSNQEFIPNPNVPYVQLHSPNLNGEVSQKPNGSNLNALTSKIPKKRQLSKPMDVPIPKKRRINGEKTTSGSACDDVLGSQVCSTPKEYTVEYHGSHALGFYCVTEKEGGPYCKIISVCPHGCATTDERIMSGTKVVSVKTVGGSLKSVASHKEMEAFCNEASTQGQRLAITFINTYVTTASISRASMFAKEWTSHGKWCGKCRTGWDGSIMPRQQRESSEYTQAPDVATGQASLRPIYNKMERGVWFDPELKQRWFFHTRNSKTFAYEDTAKVQFLARATSTLCRIPRSSTREPNEAEPRLQIRDVMNSFYDGFYSDRNWLQKWTSLKDVLESEKQAIWQQLSGGQPSEVMSQRQREIELVDNAFKFGKTWASSVQESKAIGSWKRIKICVTSVVGADVLASQWDSMNVTLATSISAKGENGAVHLLEVLPLHSLSKEVQYSLEARPVHLNVNTDLPEATFKEIVFRVTASNCDKEVSINLNASFDDLETIWRQQNGWHNHWLGFHPNHGSAPIALQFAFCQVDHDFKDLRYKLFPRLREVKNKLDGLNADIRKWNRDYDDMVKRPKLDDMYCGSSTLLHAAVYLVDPALLKELLNDGRCTLSKDGLSSVCSLAEKLSTQTLDPIRKEKFHLMIGWLRKRLNPSATYIQVERGMPLVSCTMAECAAIEVTDSPKHEKHVLEYSLLL
jgi:hypothetical protein